MYACSQHNSWIDVCATSFSVKLASGPFAPGVDFKLTMTVLTNRLSGNMMCLGYCHILGYVFYCCVLRCCGRHVTRAAIFHHSLFLVYMWECRRQGPLLDCHFAFSKTVCSSKTSIVSSLLWCQGKKNVFVIMWQLSFPN